MSFKEQHENYQRPIIKCGIYIIRNKINGKMYIGKSNNIDRRIKEHKSTYEQNRTPNKPLYKAFKKYNINNFSFETLELCPSEQLNEREKYWIKFFNTCDSKNGYNILSGGDGHDSGEKHPNHKLTREDVIDIRTRYANHEKCKDVELIYSNKIGPSGFKKVWQGITWSDIMPEVYSEENKKFHKYNTGQKGSENGRAILTEKDVYNIRLLKKNGFHKWDVYKDYEKLGIKKSSFECIWYGSNWKNVKVE